MIDTLAGGRRLSRQLVQVARSTDARCAGTYYANAVRELPKIVRARSLGPADSRMAGRTWRFRSQGVVVDTVGEDFAGAREMYARNVYFALPGFRIHPGDTVVDLGANRGLFTVLAASIARRTIAVEAQSEFMPLIRANLARNRSSGAVVLVQALVGGDSGVFSNADRMRSATHFGSSPTTMSMDDLLATHDVGTVDFMKIDIEGSEFALFASRGAWLERVRAIAMEVHTEFGDPRDLVKFLAGRGFVTTLLDNDQHVVDTVTGPSGYLFARR